MPTYDLRCTQCGHTFEHHRSLNADNPPCPKCGSAVEQVFQSMAFALRGGGVGWARNGYSAGGRKR